MKKILSIALATILFAFSCGKKDDEEDKSGIEYSPDLVSMLESLTDQYIRENAIPGAIVGIWQEGYAPLVVTSGVSDIYSNEPMKPECRFRIGDVGKSFIAEAILKLVDDKKIGLDYTLKEFFPEYAGGDSITILRLLNGTSGLHDIVFDTTFLQNFNRNHFKKWDFEDVLSASLEFRPDFKPGSAYRNSDMAYNILAQIAAKMSEKEWYSVFKHGFVKPLGLKCTEFPDTAGLGMPYAHGYTPKADHKFEDISFYNPSLLGPARGMVSNIYDLKKWIKVLGEGSLLAPETFKLQTDFSKAPNPTEVYGLGIRKIRSLIGHSGTTPGYAVEAYYYPEKKTVIIVMVNVCNMKESLATGLFMNVVSGMFPSALK